MNNKLREFQIKLIKMLDEIDKIFKENNLTYFLLGGSVLGAIRHKGIIPWDDDIDIGLYRKDFERMEKIILKYLPKELMYSKIGENKTIRGPIGLIYDISDKNLPLEKVPTIDIFPIDSVPDNFILKKVQDNFAKIYHLSVCQRSAKNRGKISFILSKGILFLLPKWILKLLELLSKKIIIFWQNKDTKRVNNIYGANKECVRKECMGNPIYKEFEGKLYPIPELYDEYLKCLYGDYMIIPSRQKRIPKHKKEILNLGE